MSIIFQIIPFPRVYIFYLCKRMPVNMPLSLSFDNCKHYYLRKTHEVGILKY